MNELIKMEFGSSVYGTRTPESDLDIKGVYLPRIEDVLMQRITHTIKNSTKKNNGKNTKDDVDVEIFSVHRFFELLIEGQTNAIDMLFIPKNHYLMTPHPFWDKIIENKHQFIHSGINSFVGYAINQAGKYGLKGGKVNSLKSVISELEKNDRHLKLKQLNQSLEKIAKEDKNVIITSVFNGTAEELFLEICNKKISFNLSVDAGLSILKKIYSNYGQRSIQASLNQNIDWKALMHAYRVANEGIELLSKKNITFPRPEKDLLLDIRNGKLTPGKVLEMIEKSVEELKDLSLKSDLPKEGNKELAQQLLMDFYRSP